MFMVEIEFNFTRIDDSQLEFIKAILQSEGYELLQPSVQNEILRIRSNDKITSLIENENSYKLITEFEPDTKAYDKLVGLIIAAYQMSLLKKVGVDSTLHHDEMGYVIEPSNRNGINDLRQRLKHAVNDIDSSE